VLSTRGIQIGAVDPASATQQTVIADVSSCGATIEAIEIDTVRVT
jgi:hypothetical protein